MTEGYPLIPSNRRYRKKRIDFDGETLPVENRPHLDVLLRATHFEIDIDKKVTEWLQEVPKWQEQPVWKPSEHPSSNRHDTFVHTYELGDDADHPIEIEDDGWFITREIVSDTGIYLLQLKWEDLPENYKRYWQKEWWNEKPWDLLVDPGAMSEDSDDL